jgi:hypothetical protein
MSLKGFHQRQWNTNRALTSPRLNLGGYHSPAMPLRTVRTVAASTWLFLRATVLPDVLLDSAPNGERRVNQLPE